MSYKILSLLVLVRVFLSISNYLVQFRVFDLQNVARIVRAGEASSEAERRNEGSTKCVRNPEKREFAMQTRDEKCYAFLAFFAKQKATLKIRRVKAR